MAATQTDLTVGRVPQMLLRYAAPVITSSLLQAVYSLVDMLVVSHLLGSAGASGVSNAAQVTTLVSQIAIGLSNGGAILAGQYFGRKDKAGQEETIGTFFTLFLLLGALAALGCWLAAGPFLTFMGAPAFPEAYAYLRISTLGFFFVFLYNAMSSVLRAVGNSRRPMYFVLAGVSLNIVLDLICVGPLRMGTAGAALATVISQALSAGLALIYLLSHRDIFSFAPGLLRLRLRRVRMILKLGIPCAIQMTVAGISWLVVTYQINDFGTVISAASAYAVRISDLCKMFITSLSAAASAMIAQNLGIQKYDRAREVMYTAMKMAMGISLALILLVEVSAPMLVRVFTQDQEAIAYAVLNLRIEVVGQIFYACFLIYHSLMTGAGHTWWVMFSSFVNCILFRVALTLLFNQVLGMGVTGVYLGCAIAPATSIPVGWYYTRSNRWRRSLAG